MLNDEQQAAAWTDANRALVISGAGSGKTRVLVARIEHLIKEKKVSPYEILCMTFTRAAAGEMRERLEKVIGFDARKIVMGTIHSIALDTIRRFGDALGLHPGTVTIYNEWESEFLLKEVAKDLGIFKKSWTIPKKDIDATFNQYYSTGTPPEESDPANTLFHAFLSRCRENNALTYGGLVHGLYLLLPQLTRYAHLEHIIVDECQDLDRLQHLIIEMIANVMGASVFMVGDVSQSIFEWRGAVPQHLLDMAPHCTVYKLQTNYRSRADIVEAANKVIRNNDLRIPLDMVPIRKSQDDIQYLHEADSEKILLSLGELAPDAILSRNHALLKKLSMMMDEAGIPNHYVGKKSELIQSEGFRRFLAFLKLQMNPRDNFSFLLIRDILGVDRGAYSEIRKLSVEQGISHYDAWRRLGDSDWIDFMEKEYGDVTNYVVGLVIRLTLSMSGASEFAGVVVDSGCKSIKSFLDWITTYDISEEVAEEATGIRLMTIHAAKGLEFPVVLLAGCNEGIIPAKQSLSSGDIEAERRLFYVAMTRARDRLILGVRPERTVSDFGKVYENPVSRFISEIGG